MIFETDTDILREKKAIDLFVSIFKGSYKKLDPLDIDYKVSDDRGQLIAYVEVVGRMRSMKTSYPSANYFEQAEQAYREATQPCDCVVL